MSKLNVAWSHRVIVEPANTWAINELDTLLGICESIKTDIKRHVDDVGDVWIDTDTEDQCSLCGAVWTEDKLDCNYCCDAEWHDYCKRVALPYIPVRTK